MNELVVINYSNPDKPTVSARALHDALHIGTQYSLWFARMADYGFIEGEDYYSNLNNRSDGLPGKPSIDHSISLDMAKEICMIQRTPEGKAFREYFIRIEKAWNDPVAVMGRALEAHKAIQKKLNDELLELKPKANYYDMVLATKDLFSPTEIAKDFGKSARWLNNWLHGLGIQFKMGHRWYLYQQYCGKGLTGTRTAPYVGKDGTMHCKTQMFWTQKGRKFIYDVFYESGLFPGCEIEKFKDKFEPPHKPS